MSSLPMTVAGRPVGTVPQAAVPGGCVRTRQWTAGPVSRQCPGPGGSDDLPGRARSVGHGCDRVAGTARFPTVAAFHRLGRLGDPSVIDAELRWSTEDRNENSFRSSRLARTGGRGCWRSLEARVEPYAPRANR